MPVKVVLAKDLLEENKEKADDLRKQFAHLGVKVVNVLSSPGAGKTTLLERTIPRLEGIRVAVIEADIATTRDADRLAKLGIPVVQITTLGGCHLDTAMVLKALPELDLSQTDLLFIENVGNLVCPSEFDLGESLRVVLLSVAEGNDKPAKYPLAFLTSQVAVISKVDLTPYTDFDMDQVRAEITGVNQGLKVFPLSAKTGEGMDEWCGWLKEWAGKAGDV